MALSLFLHSTGTGPFLWEAVPAAVTEGTQKLAPTNLGYPPNEILAAGTKVGARDDADHIAKLLPVDAGEIHLFAHSYGGLVALELLRSLGDRVRSMYLYEPVLFGALVHDRDEAMDPGASADAEAMFAHPWFLTDAERGGTDPWLEFFIDYWNKPGSWQRMPAPMQDYARLTGRKMFQEVRSCFFDAISLGAYPFGAAKTTLVMGERSPRTSREMARALHRRNPGARLVELPKGAHMTLLTNPAAVNDSLLDHRRWVAGA